MSEVECAIQFKNVTKTFGQVVANKDVTMGSVSW